MNEAVFRSDMIMDAAENAGLNDSAEKILLSGGIELRKIEIKDASAARRLNREKGVYMTLDCPDRIYASNESAEELERRLASLIKNTAGNLKAGAKILVAGLGNADVTSDSLGARVVPLIAVDLSDAKSDSKSAIGGRAVDKDFKKGAHRADLISRTQSMDCGNIPKTCSGNSSKSCSLCAVEAGVYGATGIQSAVVISALVKELRPDLVIAVDALATSSVKRLGKSYQISTAGIAPGSGVGGDKMRIDSKLLNAPVIAIGVPLVLTMNTVLNNFFMEYAARTKAAPNAAVLSEMLSEKRLSGLIVAPKDIKFYAEICASVIANAINIAFAC